MVKFAKNGSDATTAAVKLARAVTGRPLVAICSDHAFFSIDDWFIARTPMAAGIPGEIGELTVGFPYGDLAATEDLLIRNEGRSPASSSRPRPSTTRRRATSKRCATWPHRYGALLIFDEMITGFRFSASGAQGVYGVTPDLSTFGKALGNGFAVSALAGKRELMERGGLRDDHERVFLLSTTHGAETHARGAMAVMDVYAEEGISARLHELGDKLASGVREVAAAAGVEGPRRRPGPGQQPGLRDPRRELRAVAAVPHAVPARADPRWCHRPVVRGEQR